MRTVINLCILGLIATLSLTALPAWAVLEVTASVQIHAKADFDAPLAPHGTWVVVGSYGRCWRPAHVAVEWRPYCSGEWVWTDCGWYWSSDEPWAWACYHYGWWVYDASLGWVWVPQVEWAPAWVSWRVGGGYIGWAPLPPPGLIFATHPAPDLFVFVGTANFGGPVRPGAVIVKNSVIIKQTTEIGGVKRESRNLGGSGSQKVMVNNGPSVDMVQKASGKNFTAVPIRDAVRRSAARAETKHAVTDNRGAQNKTAADGRSNHGSNPGDAPAKDDAKSSPDRGSGSGSDSGPSFGGRDRGDRSGGGGHGKH